MISETSSIAPGVPQRAYRRGRILTLIVVTTSAFICAGDFIRDIMRYGRLPWASLDYGSLLFLVLLAWMGFHGGRIVSGLLVLLNGLVFSVFAVCIFCAGVRTFLPVASWPDFVRNVSEFDASRASVYFIIVGGLATFALWVLLGSKDARLYRRARRRGIVEAEANAFKWPPPQRR